MPTWPRFNTGKDLIFDFLPDGSAAAIPDPWKARLDVMQSGDGSRKTRRFLRQLTIKDEWETTDNENSAKNHRSCNGAGCFIRIHAQTSDTTFPKGELSATKNHTGNIWLSELVVGDSTFDPGVAQATYGAGAKLDWHVHPAGQVLLITEGVGYYQEKGKPGRIVRKGDVIKCLPGVEHWHAAAPNKTFAYLAVTPTSKGKTIWLGPVSSHDYQSVKQ